MHAYYEINQMYRAGAFVQYGETEVSVGSSSATFDTLYYGAEAMLTPVENVNIEVYAGLGSLSPEGSSEDIDSTIFGSRVTYGFTPSFAGHVFYNYEELDAFGSDIGVSEFGLGVDYYSDGFGSNVPFIVTAEYGKTSFSSLSGDTLAVALTIPFGGGSDSSARELFSDRGVISGVPIIGF